MNDGIVMRSTGSWYQVRLSDGAIVRCRLKGNLKMQDSRKTNFVAVGDYVELMKEGAAEGIITGIGKRKNYIIRKATNLSRQWHVLAANMDKAILVVTLAEPRTSTGFIDRFLVTCEAYNVPAGLIFNKTDLFDQQQLEDLFVLREIYSSLGYRCIETSVPDKKGLQEVKELLAGKTTLLAGHSGVGKSTLVNSIEPGLSLRTGEISDYHRKGTHTTTFAEMFPLSFGGFIIDTPGIKEFGLVDMEKYELSRYFPEMRAVLSECRFNTCLHQGEPGCAVLEALDKGEIAGFRYKNYLGMIASEEMQNEF